MLVVIWDYLAICNSLILHISDKGVTLHALPNTLHIGTHIFQGLQKKN